jgi:hypothetical protein
VAHNRAAQDKQNDTRLNYALGLVRGTNSIAQENPQPSPKDKL